MPHIVEQELRLRGDLDASWGQMVQVHYQTGNLDCTRRRLCGTGGQYASRLFKLGLSGRACYKVSL